MASTLERQRTFAQSGNALRLDWPHASPTASELALAGFKYRPTVAHNDRVVCDSCGVAVHGWTSGMRPASLHSALSSSCRIARSHSRDSGTGDEAKKERGEASSSSSSSELLSASDSLFDHDLVNENEVEQRLRVELQRTRRKYFKRTEGLSSSRKSSAVSAVPSPPSVESVVNETVPPAAHIVAAPDVPEIFAHAVPAQGVAPNVPTRDVAAPVAPPFATSSSSIERQHLDKGLSGAALASTFAGEDGAEAAVGSVSPLSSESSSLSSAGEEDLLAERPPTRIKCSLGLAVKIAVGFLVLASAIVVLSVAIASLGADDDSASSSSPSDGQNSEPTPILPIISVFVTSGGFVLILAVEAYFAISRWLVRKNVIQHEPVYSTFIDILIGLAFFAFHIGAFLLIFMFFKGEHGDLTESGDENQPWGSITIAITVLCLAAGSVSYLRVRIPQLSVASKNVESSLDSRSSASDGHDHVSNRTRSSLDDFEPSLAKVPSWTLLSLGILTTGWIGFGSFRAFLRFGGDCGVAGNTITLMSEAALLSVGITVASMSRMSVLFGVLAFIASWTPFIWGLVLGDNGGCSAATVLLFEVCTVGLMAGLHTAPRARQGMPASPGDVSAMLTTQVAIAFSQVVAVIFQWPVRFGSCDCESESPALFGLSEALALSHVLLLPAFIRSRQAPWFIPLTVFSLSFTGTSAWQTGVFFWVAGCMWLVIVPFIIPNMEFTKPYPDTAECDLRSWVVRMFLRLTRAMQQRVTPSAVVVSTLLAFHGGFLIWTHTLNFGESLSIATRRYIAAGFFAANVLASTSFVLGMSRRARRFTEVRFLAKIDSNPALPPSLRTAGPAANTVSSGQGSVHVSASFDACSATSTTLSHSTESTPSSSLSSSSDEDSSLGGPADPPDVETLDAVSHRWSLQNNWLTQRYDHARRWLRWNFVFWALSGILQPQFILTDFDCSETGAAVLVTSLVYAGMVALSYSGTMHRSEQWSLTWSAGVDVMCYICLLTVFVGYPIVGVSTFRLDAWQLDSENCDLEFMRPLPFPIVATVFAMLAVVALHGTLDVFRTRKDRYFGHVLEEVAFLSLAICFTITIIKYERFEWVVPLALYVLLWLSSFIVAEFIRRRLSVCIHKRVAVISLMLRTLEIAIFIGAPTFASCGSCWLVFTEDTISANEVEIGTNVGGLVWDFLLTLVVLMWVVVCRGIADGGYSWTVIVLCLLSAIDAFGGLVSAVALAGAFYLLDPYLRDEKDHAQGILLVVMAIPVCIRGGIGIGLNSDIVYDQRAWTESLSAILLVYGCIILAMSWIAAGIDMMTHGSNNVGEHKLLKSSEVAASVLIAAGFVIRFVFCLDVAAIVVLWTELALVVAFLILVRPLAVENLLVIPLTMFGAVVSTIRALHPSNDPAAWYGFEWASGIAALYCLALFILVTVFADWPSKVQTNLLVVDPGTLPRQVFAELLWALGLLFAAVAGHYNVAGGFVSLVALGLTHIRAVFVIYLFRYPFGAVHPGAGSNQRQCGLIAEVLILSSFVLTIFFILRNFVALDIEEASPAMPGILLLVWGAVGFFVMNIAWAKFEQAAPPSARASSFYSTLMNRKWRRRTYDVFILLSITLAGILLGLKSVLGASAIASVIVSISPLCVLTFTRVVIDIRSDRCSFWIVFTPALVFISAMISMSWFPDFDILVPTSLLFSTSALCFVYFMTFRYAVTSANNEPTQVEIEGAWLQFLVGAVLLSAWDYKGTTFFVLAAAVGRLFFLGAPYSPRWSTLTTSWIIVTAFACSIASGLNCQGDNYCKADSVRIFVGVLLLVWSMLLWIWIAIRVRWPQLVEKGITRDKLWFHFVSAVTGVSAMVGAGLLTEETSGGLVFVIAILPAPVMLLFTGYVPACFMYPLYVFAGTVVLFEQTDLFSQSLLEHMSLACIVTAVAFTVLLALALSRKCASVCGLNVSQSIDAGLSEEANGELALLKNYSVVVLVLLVFGAINSVWGFFTTFAVLSVAWWLRSVQGLLVVPLFVASIAFRIQQESDKEQAPAAFGWTWLVIAVLVYFLVVARTPITGLSFWSEPARLPSVLQWRKSTVAAAAEEFTAFGMIVASIVVAFSKDGSGYFVVGTLLFVGVVQSSYSLAPQFSHWVYSPDEQVECRRLEKVQTWLGVLGMLESAGGMFYLASLLSGEGPGSAVVAVAGAGILIALTIIQLRRWNAFAICGFPAPSQS